MFDAVTTPKPSVLDEPVWMEEAMSKGTIPETLGAHLSTTDNNPKPALLELVVRLRRIKLAASVENAGEPLA
jgi:hypothetical protein